MYSAKKPLVAIVGRPNVGKSTLFNRLVGRPVSIVSDVAGTTRDRVSTETVWADYPFILVDTGGLDERNDGGEATPTQIWEKVRSQIDVAIEDADVIIMLTDVGTGLTPADYDVAEALRRARKSVIVAVNKSDNVSREQEVFDFYDLGLGDPIPISAYHNVGVDDLMSKVIASFPPEPDMPEVDADLKVALVGRTNAGKSMLLNALVGEERSIVSETPGTTRDAVDTAHYPRRQPDSRRRYGGPP